MSEQIAPEPPTQLFPHVEQQAYQESAWIARLVQAQHVIIIVKFKLI